MNYVDKNDVCGDCIFHNRTFLWCDNLNSNVGCCARDTPACKWFARTRNAISILHQDLSQIDIDEEDYLEHLDEEDDLEYLHP